MMMFVKLVTKVSNLLAICLTTDAFNGLRTQQSLKYELQKCHTPIAVLEIGGDVSPNNDPDGSVASLALLRVAKQLISSTNQGLEVDELIWEDVSPWARLCDSLSSALREGREIKADLHVEAIKAMAALSRLVPNLQQNWKPYLKEFQSQSSQLIGLFEPHHLSGLKFAYDCFQTVSSHDLCFPSDLQVAYDDLDLPFRIVPCCLSKSGIDDLSVNLLASQVRFQVDDIRTTSNRVVKERRQTAWEGEDHVPPFQYSGKSMERQPWSPLVKEIRDAVLQKTGEDYDCCLLNLYPDGGSGMRYHIDPDQGTLWDYSTAVVSVGATRRFALRETPRDGVPTSQPHTFVLMEGDVTEMFGDCQNRFQHTVKKADNKTEAVPRASLVFKRTFSG